MQTKRFKKKEKPDCFDILWRFWKLYVCLGITAAIGSLILLIVATAVGYNTVSALTSPTTINHLVSNIMTNKETSEEFQALLLNSLENENLQSMLVELVSKAFTIGIFPKIDTNNNDGFFKSTPSENKNCIWDCEETYPVCSSTCQMCSLFKGCVQSRNQTICLNYARQMYNFCSTK